MGKIGLCENEKGDKMKIGLCASLLILAACEPVIDSRGYNPDKMDLKKIVIKKTTKDDVLQLLGSPTNTAEVIGKCGKGEAWYYISKKTETTAFFKPEICEQKVIRLVFNEKDIVTKVDDLSKSQGVDLDPDSDQTETTGYEESLGRSVLGTFGRMLNTTKKPKKTEDE
ncbi:MAG: hypothetical protein CNLJKLNK_01061 [Holosporales bacterium]